MAFQYTQCTTAAFTRRGPLRKTCAPHAGRGVAAARRRSARWVAAVREPVRVGSVVAVERGRGQVDLARVAGVAADGATVDLVVLKEFVREMYVDGGGGATYERIENVRAVASEYVPAQEGWIVLDQDLADVKVQFAARAPGGQNLPTVVITAEQTKELSEEALRSQRGFPKPTKVQALVGAATCLPLAAWAYSGFAGAREAYNANPVGQDAAEGAIRQTIIFAYSSGVVLCLVVGSALLLYALGGAADAES
jgi:hypothetical protein